MVVPQTWSCVSLNVETTLFHTAELGLDPLYLLLLGGIASESEFADWPLM